MNLQLTLTKKWFDLTKEGVKKEDYREITPYWCTRFLTQNGEVETQNFWKHYLETFGIETLKKVYMNYSNVHRIKSKVFDKNIMTHGYPKKEDAKKRLVYQHEGIEIRTGNTEWGAKQDEIYFVIKHGEQVAHGGGCKK